MPQLTNRFETITAMLCAKFQNDWTTETNVMDERGFARFEFKTSFWQISHIAVHTTPGTLSSLSSYCNSLFEYQKWYMKSMGTLAIFIELQSTRNNIQNLAVLYLYLVAVILLPCKHNMKGQKVAAWISPNHNSHPSKGHAPGEMNWTVLTITWSCSTLYMLNSFEEI